MPSLKIKRGTRVQLNAAATAGTLKEGEPYLISDEGRIAIGTSATTYQDFAKLSEAGGGSGETKVILTSDVAVTANTFQNVTGLSFPVLANNTYHFYCLIFYTSATTNVGSRWSVTGPASPTLLSYQSTYTLTATSSTVNYLSAYDSPAAANATSLTTGNIALIEGFVRPSTNGTMQIRCASETNGQAITAKAGSILRYEETL